MLKASSQGFDFGATERIEKVPQNTTNEEWPIGHADFPRAGYVRERVGRV
ncbi:MAG TPA: hypothetical protein VMV69_17165 [Pirellulales bacterium]|nr:hypothetical protein [Pirellulales bacterium]